MCLAMAVERPEDILEKGTHLGFEYVINHNRSGFRCGYVKVEPGHPWHGKEYGELDVEAHGGLTFSDADVDCAAEGEDNGWWVGFDCGHAYDAPDFDLPWRDDRTKEIMLEFHGVGTQLFKRETLKDTDYVRKWCFLIAKQAFDAISHDVTQGEIACS